MRKMDLGHQVAGIYQNRSRAAHWDGRNKVGEPVASGVYFYTLTADDFTATRENANNEIGSNDLMIAECLFEGFPNFHKIPPYNFISR